MVQASRVKCAAALALAVLIAGSCTVEDGQYTFPTDGAVTAGENNSINEGGESGASGRGAGGKSGGAGGSDATSGSSTGGASAGESTGGTGPDSCSGICTGPLRGEGSGVCENGVCRIECATGAELCGSECADTDHDGAHCGGCDAPCAPGLVCQGGKCTSECAEGLRQCGTSCVDVATSTDHCGACDKPCGGTCTQGVCCAKGQTNCDGKCVNLQSDVANCLTCGHACAAGQVCDSGTCAKDCGAKDRCADACVSLASDPSNCQACGKRCSAPAKFGTAVCEGSAGCGIQCESGHAECGAACCDSPPQFGSITCTSNKCTAKCNSNYHSCNGTSSPCYADTDVSHCGAGCTDCKQPNAQARCASSGCANTCLKNTLACAGSGGKPACGSWNFESGTVEGWKLTSGGASIATSTAWANDGTRSLAITFTGNGTGTNKAARLRIQLCPNADILGAVPVVGGVVHVMSAKGSGPIGSNQYWWDSWNGANYVSVEDAWSADEDGIEFPQSRFGEAITDIGFTFDAPEGWKGTVYVDQISVTF